YRLPLNSPPMMDCRTKRQSMRSSLRYRSVRSGRKVGLTGHPLLRYQLAGRELRGPDHHALPVLALLVDWLELLVLSDVVEGDLALGEQIAAEGPGGELFSDVSRLGRTRILDRLEQDPRGDVAHHRAAGRLRAVLLLELRGELLVLGRGE